MTRRRYRKAILGQISEKGDVIGLLYRYGKSRQAARIFVEWLKNKGCKASPKELGQFTRDLQAGRVRKGFTYRRESFYKIVLHRLIDFGFIGVFTTAQSTTAPSGNPSRREVQEATTGGTSPTSSHGPGMNASGWKNEHQAWGRRIQIGAYRRSIQNKTFTSRLATTFRHVGPYVGA